MVCGVWALEVQNIMSFAMELRKNNTGFLKIQEW
jgi:hypothetical protein